MELNMDLVRKILLWMESDPAIKSNPDSFDDLGDQFRDDQEKIKTLRFDGNMVHHLDGSEIEGEAQELVLYQFKKLIEANFVNGEYNAMNGEPITGIASISDISFQGHQFLDEIRDDKNWRKIKFLANGIGSLSIDVIQKLAKEVIEEGFKGLGG